MPRKVFTTLGGKCPYKGCEIDSQSCRACEYYYRAGMGTFFWCKHPFTPEPEAPRPIETGRPKRKPGRPRGKASKKPVKTRKIKK